MQIEYEQQFHLIWINRLGLSVVVRCDSKLTECSSCRCVERKSAYQWSGVQILVEVSDFFFNLNFLGQLKQIQYNFFFFLKFKDQTDMKT